MPAVYLVLGLPGSGRHEVVRHLIEGVLPATPPTLLFLTETDDETAAVELEKLPGVLALRYRFVGGEFETVGAVRRGDEPETVFFFTDGRKSPIDQIEAFPGWLRARGWELSRILLVVDCALCAAHPAVAQWHEDCAYFADCILLNRRDAGAHAWAQQFQKKCAQLRYPCLVLPVKNAQVDNPHLVLFPEARRLSLVFDNIDPVDSLELDEENLPDEPFSLENKPDPYFERLPNGQRKKPLPDVAPFLGK